MNERGIQRLYEKRANMGFLDLPVEEITATTNNILQPWSIFINHPKHLNIFEGETSIEETNPFPNTAFQMRTHVLIPLYNRLDVHLAYGESNKFAIGIDLAAGMNFFIEAVKATGQTPEQFSADNLMEIYQASNYLELDEKVAIFQGRTVFKKELDDTLVDPTGIRISNCIINYLEKHPFEILYHQIPQAVLSGCRFSADILQVVHGQTTPNN